MPTSENQVIFSDLLSDKGVWRQPLEIIVQHFNPKYDARASVDVPFDVWFHRPAEVRKLQCAALITDQSLPIAVGERGGYEPHTGRDVDHDDRDADYDRDLSPQCCWTATKVTMGEFSG